MLLQKQETTNERLLEYEYHHHTQCVLFVTRAPPQLLLCYSLSPFLVCPPSSEVAEWGRRDELSFPLLAPPPVVPWSPIHSDVEEEENVKKNYDNRERENKKFFRQNVTPNHVNYKFRENVNISEFFILRGRQNLRPCHPRQHNQEGRLPMRRRLRLQWARISAEETHKKITSCFRY